MEKDLKITLKDAQVMAFSQVVARDSVIIRQQLATQTQQNHDNTVVVKLQVQLPDVSKSVWNLATKCLLPGRGMQLEFEDLQIICPMHKKCGFANGVLMCETVLEKMLMHPHVGAREACHCCLEHGIQSQTDKAIQLVKEAFGISEDGRMTKLLLPYWLEGDDFTKFLDCRSFHNPTLGEERNHNISDFTMAVAACARFHEETGKNSQEISLDEEFLLGGFKDEMNRATAMDIIGEGEDFCANMMGWLEGCSTRNCAREFKASPNLFHIKSQFEDLEQSSPQKVCS